MSDIDSTNKNEDGLVCPVCNVSTGASGPFVSDWAVACHIAGKARTGDRLHRSWALSKVGDLDFKSTLNDIALHLQWAVVEAFRERKTPEESPSNQRLKGPYEKISAIERRLHKFIENTLKREFGESEEEWWVKGIPLSIRQKCMNRREEDNRRQDEYSYTDLIDLQPILNNNWRLFEVDFKRTSSQCKSKNEFLNSLGKLNEIRKVIMHPVRLHEELSEKEARLLDRLDVLIREFVCGD